MTCTQHAAQVFGLQPHLPAEPPIAALPLPAPGQILALTGPSGAGKTRALRALGARMVQPGPMDTPVPAHFDCDGEAAFRALAACGLADGRLWSLKPGQLSAGEQQRLWLAVAIAGAAAGQVIVADEFDSHLDFEAACALARNLHRLARVRRLRLVVSTHRPELLPWLAPARMLHLDGGLEDIAPPAPRELAAEVTCARGTLGDWPRFAHWHYLGAGNPGPVAAVWLASLRGRAAGIAVFSFPHLLLSARCRVLPEPAWPRQVLASGAGWLNANLRLLSRVVVDPRLRGCGIAGALLRHALPTLGVPFVECIAQMGEYTGFLRHAGFVPAGHIEPPRAVRSLQKWLAATGVQARELLDPAARQTLCARHPRLQRMLRALLQSRVQSGHGALRGGHGNEDAALQRALGRIAARPGYHLWQARP